MNTEKRFPFTVNTSFGDIEAELVVTESVENEQTNTQMNKAGNMTGSAMGNMSGNIQNDKRNLLCTSKIVDCQSGHPDNWLKN
jgi:hypothetical protein